MRLKSTIPMLFLLLALFTGCSKMPPLSGTISLDARGEWKPVVYLLDPKTWGGIGGSYLGTVLDSATIQPDGSFAFEKMPEAADARLFELAIQPKAEAQHPNRLDNDDPGTSNYFPLVYKNGEAIVVKAEAAHFQRTFSIEKPSDENAAMLQLRDIRQAAFDQFLGGKKDGEAHDESALLDEEAAKLSFQKPIMQFAEQTNYLLPALTAIRWVSVEGDYERVPEFIVAQAERWKATAPGHPWVAQMAAKGDRKTLPVLVGDQIPTDYPMPMLSGDTVSLKTLLGKRLTLLDFWASWCAPCRKENRNTLVSLWEKQHESGFQIVGYALDASTGAWSTAIEKDGVGKWPHASHLQGDDAPLFKELRMTSIPANFLLDENGKVLAKNLHGEELVKWVEALFGD
ncbi:MAG: TlpA family protein disulfide reductase [Saprospiraceae bacterium]|nr:TlpA family protein disulfide reductase [Saprospiraceae bacterium]MCF8282137.1 TlpA family protein disulfide reductase [Bacteroidales bacterium]